MESLIRDSCLVDLIENLLWKTGNKHLVESAVDVDNLEVKLETEQNSSKTDNEQVLGVTEYCHRGKEVIILEIQPTWPKAIFCYTNYHTIPIIYCVLMYYLTSLESRDKL